MRRYLYLLLLPVFTAALFSIASAQSQNGSQELKKLQDKFKSINTLSADFHQSGSLSGKNGGQMEGRFFYQKDNKYRIELKNTTIVSDGRVLWNYNRNGRKLVINDLQNESPAFSLKSIIYDYPSQSRVESLGKEQSGGRQYSVLRLTSKDDESSFKTAKLWVDEENLLKKIEIRGAGGAVQTFELTSVKINQNIPSEKFTFKAPEGSEVIDLR